MVPAHGPMVLTRPIWAHGPGPWPKGPWSWPWAQKAHGPGPWAPTGPHKGNNMSMWLVGGGKTIICGK